MSTRDGTVIRDCRTCKYSEYENKYTFNCTYRISVLPTKMTRPRKCKNFSMDEKYADANNVKLKNEGSYIYKVKEDGSS